jgi:voltage-gated potassium channel
MAQKHWRARLYEIVFEADTAAGKMFDITLLVLIILSTLTVMIETMPEIPSRYNTYFYNLEWFFTGVFTVEYLLRITAVQEKRKYIFSFLGIVDLLSILPTYLAIFISGAQVFLVIRVIRLFRIFRILKLAQFIGAGDTLRTALVASRHKISVFLLSVIMIVIISGTIMYLIEGESNGFSSIPRSIYWAIVTLTTVGYGDIAPKTLTGQTIASVIMILGYGILAVPTGIVSAEMIQMKSKEKLSTQVCPHCMRDSHDSDAVYCKYCSGKLN